MEYCVSDERKTFQNQSQAQKSQEMRRSTRCQTYTTWSSCIITLNIITISTETITMIYGEHQARDNVGISKWSSQYWKKANNQRFHLIFFSASVLLMPSLRVKNELDMRKHWEISWEKWFKYWFNDNHSVRWPENLSLKQHLFPYEWLLGKSFYFSLNTD